MLTLEEAWPWWSLVNTVSMGWNPLLIGLGSPVLSPSPCRCSPFILHPQCSTQDLAVPFLCTRASLSKSLSGPHSLSVPLPICILTARSRHFLCKHALNCTKCQHQAEKSNCWAGLDLLAQARTGHTGFLGLVWCSLLPVDHTAVPYDLSYCASSLLLSQFRNSCLQVIFLQWYLKSYI